MDGDIDIEEHDILDNPRVKKLFPNLCKIKTEVTYYEVPIVQHKPPVVIKQEEFTKKQQDDNAVRKTEFNNTTNINVSENSHSVLHNRLKILPRANIAKIINNSLAKLRQNISLEHKVRGYKNTKSIDRTPDTDPSKSFFKTIVEKSEAIKPLIKEEEASDSVHLQYNRRGLSKCRNFVIVRGTNDYNTPEVSSPNVKSMLNNIIPASKALSVVSSAKEYLPAAVVLNDCITILKLSSRYCDSCKILFPSKHSFNAHRWSTHYARHESTSNAVDTEPDVSEVSKSSESAQPFACLKNWNKRNIVHNNNKKLNYIVTYFEPNKISYGKRNKKIAGKLTLVAKEDNNNVKHKFYKVYPCLDCNIYYLASNARKTHIMRDNHKILLKPKHCRFCKLRFANELFKKHANECPVKGNTGYYIKVMEYKKTTNTKKSDDVPDSPEELETATLSDGFEIVKIEKPDTEDVNEMSIADDSDVDIVDDKWIVKPELDKAEAQV
ncbi:hypothetical protein K1T71_014751 [Dendrolimus kikuchii]|nr:hypothetical protein K1T71_014751 [Dendrolimus kikuchii]